MRAWIAVLVGLLALVAVSAVVAEGRDNTGETVRASRWADDVCGAVAAWEGQLEVIGDQLSLSNVGARRSDGGSGDSVEGTIYVRDAIDRAIQATDDTLGEGLKRAGAPDVPEGEEASQILLEWAQRTEDRLRLVKEALRVVPNTTATAFAGLGSAVAVLENAAIAGREAFGEVAALDPQLSDALEGERTCSDLRREEP
ncbi:MAG TPA: hypothetical protein VK874_13505 [Gaiellaceae bacterium]|nr:hypothetical protein [Gaiellaceae bacterium]